MPVDAAVQHLRWASGTDDPDATGPVIARAAVRALLADRDERRARAAAAEAHLAVLLPALVDADAWLEWFAGRIEFWQEMTAVQREARRG